MTIGSATEIQSGLPPSIYFADVKKIQVKNIDAASAPMEYASSAPVSASEQIGINTAIKLSEKTYFVQLDPSSFPSYSGSLDIAIAMQNWTSLSQVSDIKWPVTAFSSTVLKSLLAVMKIYTGHSFTVCDVFGNGDSACFVPDPVMNNVLRPRATIT